MLEESREAANYFSFVEIFGDLQKGLEGHACLGGPWSPNIRHEFCGFEFTLERAENAPLQIIEPGNSYLGNLGELLAPRAGFHAAAAGVPHAEGEQAFGGHEAKMFCADLVGQERAMLVHRIPLRDLESSPELVI